jgi:hypothetical protein
MTPLTWVRLVVATLALVVLGLLLGCSRLDEREQKTVSGAAIGGTLACWPGAALGAGIGYLVGHSEGGDE